MPAGVTLQPNPGTTELKVYLAPTLGRAGCLPPADGVGQVSGLAIGPSSEVALAVGGLPPPVSIISAEKRLITSIVAWNVLTGN